MLKEKQMNIWKEAEIVIHAFSRKLDQIIPDCLPAVIPPYSTFPSSMNSAWVESVHLILIQLQSLHTSDSFNKPLLFTWYNSK